MGSLVASGGELSPKKLQNTPEEIRVLAVHGRASRVPKICLRGLPRARRALRMLSIHPKESAEVKHDFPQMSGQSQPFHSLRGHLFGKEDSILPRDVYGCVVGDRQGVAANGSGPDRVEPIASRA